MTSICHPSSTRFLDEILGCLQGLVEHGAVGHDGGIASGAGDAGFAGRLRYVGESFGFEMVIEKLVLAENNRVVDGDRFEHHAVGVFHGGGGHDDESGVVRVDRFHALAVEGAGAERSAAGQAHDDGARDVGAVVKRGGLVDDLVEADGREVGELHFHDGTRAFDGCSDGQSDDGIFAQGRIHDASGKFRGEILRRFEGPAEDADVLPVDEDAGVVGQRLFLGGADGFEVGDAHSSSAS
jgi:hypothetical protein